VLEPLDVDDLYGILKNPNNPVILGKREDFRSYAIDIRFRDEALCLLAKRAALEKTGARGLVSVIEKVLLGYEKRLPSSPVRYLVVTEEVVKNPVGELEKILAAPDDPARLSEYRAFLDEEKDRLREELAQAKRRYMENYPLIFTPERLELVMDQHMKTGLSLDAICDEVVLLYNQVRVFEADYYEKHAFRIHFDEEAMEEIINQAVDRDETAALICQRVSRDYDYGFKLVSERTGQSQFILPRKAVEFPDTYLDELIRDAYRQYPLGTPEFKQEA
jgi:hypothetical protein